MSTNPQSAIGSSEHDTVRRQVRGLLERSEAYASLQPEQRRKLARDLVEVVSFMADPAAGQGDLTEVAAAVGRAPAATALATAKKRDGQQQEAKTGQDTGADFTAGAGREAAELIAQEVQAVDFPKFVASLVEGVFQSIVDASIRQMEAYGKLLEVVVASVKDFADENVSADSARDYVVSHYPKAFSRSTDGEGKLVKNPDLEDDQLPDLKKDLGADVSADVDDEEEEGRIVEAARLKMARLKQQQLATMVLMGINRIVVTDGKINAKVVFDFSAKDRASRSAQRDLSSTYDRTQEDQSSESSFWGTSSSSTKVTTKVSSAYNAKAKSESASELEAKTKLTGEVTVNFKSETFPLERLDPSQLGVVKQRAGE